MSGQSDLLASFGQLSEAITGLAVNNAIKKAQSKVDELNQNAELTQFEKIKQQQAIAKQVSGSILGMGGSASAAQNAMMSLAPEIPDARMAQLEGTGKTNIADATQALQDEEEKRQFDKEKRAYQRQKMLQDDAQEHALEIASMKATGKAAGKPVPPALSNKLAELSEMKSNLQDLKDNFAEKGSQIGPLDQFRPNLLTSSDAVAYKSQVKDFFNQYRRVITGAAASIPELKSLLPSVPNETDYDNDFLSKIDTQIAGVDRAVKARIKLLKAQGRDTTDLEEALGIDVSGPLPQGDGKEGGVSAAPAAGGINAFIKFKP